MISQFSVSVISVTELYTKSHGLISFHELSRMIGDSWKEVDVETRAFCDCLSAISMKKYRELKASVADATAYVADATIRKTKKNKSGKEFKYSSPNRARANPIKKKGKCYNIAIEESPVLVPPLPVLVLPLLTAANALPVGPSPSSMMSTAIPRFNLQGLEEDAGNTSKARATWSMIVSSASSSSFITPSPTPTANDTEKVLVNLYLAHLERESKSNGIATDTNITHFQAVNAPDNYIRSLWNNHHTTTEGNINTEMDVGSSTTSSSDRKSNSITEMDSQNVDDGDEFKNVLNTLDLGDNENEADQDEHLHDELASMPFHDVEDTTTKATSKTIERTMTPV